MFPDSSFDSGEMALKSLQYGSFGLTHILFTTCFTGDTVDKVRTPTGDINFGLKNFTGHMAFDCATGM